MATGVGAWSVGSSLVEVEAKYFCLRCEGFKPASDFRKSKRSLSGVHQYCKICDPAVRRQRSLGDPLVRAAYQAATELLKQNPELFADIIRRNRQEFEPIWRKHKERAERRVEARRQIMVTLVCERCKAPFEKLESYVDNKQSRGTPVRFCSKPCTLGVVKARQLESYRRGEGHAMGKLTTVQVYEIRRAFAQGERQATIARRYEITSRTVWQIVHRHTWTHLAPRFYWDDLKSA